MCLLLTCSVPCADLLTHTVEQHLGQIIISDQAGLTVSLPHARKQCGDTGRGRIDHVDEAEAKTVNVLCSNVPQTRRIIEHFS